MAVFSAFITTYLVMHRWVFARLLQCFPGRRIYPLEIVLQGEGIQIGSYSGKPEESVIDLEQYTA